MPTLPVKRCNITLDQFAKITGLDPCALYGIDSGLGNECVLFDCARRSQFIYALESAVNLIKIQLHGPLCDEARTLKSQVPYFTAPPDWLLQTRRTETVTMAVVVPEVLAEPPCVTLITLTGELELAECETFISAELAQAGCACPRLASEFCSATYEVTATDPDTGAQTIEVTIVLRAYYLNDSLTVVDGTDLDWLPEEVDIDFTIALPVKEATSFWQPQPLCCPEEDETCEATACCHLQECCVCVQRSPAGLVQVRDWQKCCLQTCCNPFPHHFELGVVVPGEWRAGFDQAVVSLANNLLPQDWCSCNPLANMRYMADTGMVENGQVKPDAMFYSNPFGIFTPGAKKAWSIVNSSTAKPLVFSM